MPGCKSGRNIGICIPICIPISRGGVYSNLDSPFGRDPKPGQNRRSQPSPNVWFRSSQRSGRWLHCFGRLSYRKFRNAFSCSSEEPGFGNCPVVSTHRLASLNFLFHCSARFAEMVPVPRRMVRRCPPLDELAGSSAETCPRRAARVLAMLPTGIRRRHPVYVWLCSRRGGEKKLEISTGDRSSVEK